MGIRIVISETVVLIRVQVLDADVNYCMECETEFSFFKRKHHCRACGSVVCGTCSPYQARIPNIDEPGGSRVCVNCFGLKVNVSVMKPFDTDISPNGSVDMSDDRSSLSGEGESARTASHANGENGAHMSEKKLRREQQRRERKEEAQLRMKEAAKIPQYQRAYR
jgi:hypothetical protein